MRKLLEVEVNEDYRKSQFIQYAISILIFSLFLFSRSIERSFFDIDFFLEGFFLFMLLKFYGRSHKEKNYAFWGITLLIVIYLVMHVLHYTFINYNIFILYFSFLAGLFLFINSYVMSSPLYYPRIQWWEYDFRFSGELKAMAKKENEEFEVRLADLRRSAVSILSFEILSIGEELQVTIPYGQKSFEIAGTIKTQREPIPGRPIQYGVILDESNEAKKQMVIDLKKIWKFHHKANLRRKFAAHKEEHGI